MFGSGKFSIEYDNKKSLESAVVKMMGMFSTWEDNTEEGSVRNYTIEKVCDEENDIYRLDMVLSVEHVEE